MSSMAKNRDKGKDYSDIESMIQDVKDLDDYLSVVLYGRSGTGKTTLGCDFPGPVLLIDINDKGTKSVKDKKGLKVIRITDWVEIEQTYWYLKKHKKLFKTVVLDTVTMMQQLAMKHLLDQKNGGNNGGMLTRKDWGEVGALLTTWLMNYRDLDLNKVYIAQDKISKGGDEEVNDQDGQILPEVGPRLSPSVASTLNAAVDIIGNTFIREKYVKIKTEDKKIAKVRKVSYCLRVGPHAYYTTKVRKPKNVEVPELIVAPTYEKLVATLEE